jgi:anaerobic ribonucleoside-triphosphate reductase
MPRGHLHIHDLSLLSVYCVGWDLTDLLRNGFKGCGRQGGKRTAQTPALGPGPDRQFLLHPPGEAAGAQALSNFDTLLAPSSDTTAELHEVKQALQEFVFNINIPTRVGFQTPVHQHHHGSLRTGHPEGPSGDRRRQDKKATYGEFQAEMDTFNRAFAEVMIEGDAKGRVFTFPIPTYNITKDFDWDNPNLETVWEDDRQIRHPLLLQLRQFGHVPGRCPLHVLPPETGQPGTAQTRRRPVRRQSPDRLHRRGDHQSARIGHVAKNETDFFDSLRR